MSILSITFHTIESQLLLWQKFVDEELFHWLEDLNRAEKYILSEVESEMLTEGKNTNLLIIFDQIEKRNDFVQKEFLLLVEKISYRFGDAVMIFKTELNSIKKSF